MFNTKQTAQISSFPKLDRVARSQRRLKWFNSLATLVFAAGALFVSIGALSA